MLFARGFSLALGGVALAFAACGGSSASGGDGGSGGADLLATGTQGATTATSSAASGSGGSSTNTTGAGGATSTSTSASSGARGGNTDPCAGASDGAHCGGDLGGLADHASLYQCQGGQTQSAMGCPNGCVNGACTTPPQDPCASAMSGNGDYCGGSLAGGDPGSLYNCKNGSTNTKTACPAGCKVNPPKIPDVCNPQGDPCVNANGGNGPYCGGGIQGDPSLLYQCVNKKTQSTTMCPNGCQINMSGQADVCKSNGGSGCCLNKPPGSETQPFTACGNGGSHYGIDYGTPVGTPIYIGMSGTVVGSALGFPNCYNNGCDKTCWNSFNYVKIKSDCGDPSNAADDFFFYYLHINDLAPGVGNGTHLNQGDLVAYSGNSGCSSGPHIHLEAVSVPMGQSAVLNTCASVDPSTRYCP